MALGRTNNRITKVAFDILVTVRGLHEEHVWNEANMRGQHRCG